MNFTKKARPRNWGEKKQKEDTLEYLYSFLESREMAFHGFKSKIFLFQTAEVKYMSVRLADHKVFDCSRLKY